MNLLISLSAVSGNDRTVWPIACFKSGEYPRSAFIAASEAHIVSATEAASVCFFIDTLGLTPTNARRSHDAHHATVAWSEPIIISAAQ